MSLSSLATRQAIRAPNVAALVGSPPAVQKDVFEPLTRYLPTETITLFLAAIAAGVQTPSIDIGGIELHTSLVLYAGFALLTPTLYLGLAYVKQREAERQAGVSKAPFRPHPWPPIAATIAFLIWALSLKGVMSDSGLGKWGGLLAVAAIVVSSLLSLVDRVLNLKPAA